MNIEGCERIVKFNGYAHSEREILLLSKERQWSSVAERK
jgi:hypothetical protein